MDRYCYHYAADSDQFGVQVSGADMRYCTFDGTEDVANCSISDNPYLDGNIDLNTYPDYPTCKSVWIGTG